MKLEAIVAMGNNGVTWNSPNEPVGSDYLELNPYITPISTLHPPSLKNPQDVKVPTAQDGWKPGSSKAAREQAIADLVEVHKRMRRQIGKPEVAHTALYPMFPDMMH